MSHRDTWGRTLGQRDFGVDRYQRLAEITWLGKVGPRIISSQEILMVQIIT